MDDDRATPPGTWELETTADYVLETGGEISELKLKYLPVVVTAEEVHELILQAGSAHEGAAWRTLYMTGIRPEELLALESTPMEGGHLRLPDRCVAIDAVTLNQLRQLSGPRPFLWTLEELQSRLEAVAARTGLLERYRGCDRQLTPYLFRHAFALQALQSGMDIFTVYHLMGHRRFWVTERYFPCNVQFYRSHYLASHPIGSLPEPDLRGLPRDEDDSLSTRADGTQNPLCTPNPAEAALLLGAGLSLRTVVQLRLFYATGLRIGELAELRFANFFHAEGRLHVIRGKGDKDRYVLLDPGTSRLVLRYQGTRKPGDKLFPVTTRTLRRSFDKVARDTGLRAKYEALQLSLAPHSMRYAFATHLHLGDMPPEGIQQLLGHEHLDMTHRYVQPDFPHARRRYARTMPFGWSAAASDSEMPETEAPTADADEDEDDALSDYAQRLAELIRELTPELPAGRITLGQLPLIANRREIEALLLQPGDALERLAWRLLYSTGLRASELLQLGPDSLDCGHLRLTDRRVPLDADSAAELRQLSGPRWFPWSEAELDARLLVTAAATGLLARYTGSQRVLTPALFRHAFCAHRLEDGLDELTLQQLAGHQCTSTTLRYRKCIFAEGTRAFDACHPFALHNAAVDPDTLPSIEPEPPGNDADSEAEEDDDDDDERTRPYALPLFEEVLTIVGAAKLPREIILLYVVVNTGMRLSELSRLRFADIDHTERTVMVRFGKDQIDYYTRIDPTTSRLLRQWQGDRPPGDLVFDRGHGALGETIKRVVERTGINDKYLALEGKRVTAHSFRKALATYCYRNGVPPLTLRTLLGHDFLETTLGYVANDFAHSQAVYHATLGKPRGI